MRDRLEQIRKLLAPNGSVWVHCDDAEQAYLKVLMDDIFGRSNFQATIVWQRKYSRQPEGDRAGARLHPRLLAVRHLLEEGQAPVDP